ncbi:hypothetical protein ACFYMO_30685 [Streptomyces sp. NPDC007025]|uniref:hypothetical protein n=1 Tax=Streptomyces sp. NPDC007025 TaxID=3364771 RepID=UPI0036911B8E
MGNRDWWAEESSKSAAWHVTESPTPELSRGVSPPPGRAPTRARRRTLPLIAVITVLGIALAGVWSSAADDQRQQERKEKAAAYKGVSATNLTIDGVKIQAAAKWDKDGQSAVLSVWVDSHEEPRLVRIASGNRTAKEEPQPREPGIPMPITLEMTVPIKDRYHPVRMELAARGPLRGHQVRHRTVEFRSDRTAVDTKTGKKLKQHYSRLF